MHIQAGGKKKNKSSSQHRNVFIISSDFYSLQKFQLKIIFLILCFVWSAEVLKLNLFTHKLQPKD